MKKKKLNKYPSLNEHSKSKMERKYEELNGELQSYQSISRDEVKEAENEVYVLVSLSVP